MNIRIIHIGNVSLGKDGSVYSLKNYSLLLNELSGILDDTRLFAGVWKEGDTGYDFSNEVKLNDKIDLTLSRGNTPDTRLFFFFLNNLRLFFKLTVFCWPKDNYFIFLPSPIGILGLLLLFVYKRKKSIGIYIGGHYGAEQKFEKRKGFLKRIIKKTGASIVDSVVEYGIRHSDYVITSSYQYFERFRNKNNLFLTPPLLNVDENDLSYPAQDNNIISEGDRFITFCGELRHAKGIVDLLNAFMFCIKEDKYQNLKLKIIGSGQALPELEQIVNENNLSQRIIFCGQIKDREVLKKELKNSSIFVLPSYSEGFPRNTGRTIGSRMLA